MKDDGTSGRNIWIEFSSALGKIQGGLSAPNNLTEKQFINIINIVFKTSGGLRVSRSGSTGTISLTDETLQHGRYILSPKVLGDEILISDEVFYPRIPSPANTKNETKFHAQVRLRDRRCVISGDECLEAEYDCWIGFQAAHIVPVTLANIFAEERFTDLINHNNPPSVDSPQNGILLRADIQQLWDNYSLSVNPDDGYKVYSFRPSSWKFHNRDLHPACRQTNNPQGVIPALLRWHFEQAVLCNMRGNGEPSFEFDFPPGTDMMGEILNAPQAAQRMEAELFTRLCSLYDGVRHGDESDSQ